MGSAENLSEVIDSDVLVIGGGLAGLRAALRAREEVERVVLVDKAFVSKTGYSKFATGTMMVMLPGDDPETCLKDLLAGQEWLIDPDEAEYILSNSFLRLQELEKLGAEYAKVGDKYRTVVARGAKHLRNVSSAIGGERLLTLLLKRALHRGIKVVNKVYVSDLVTSDGRVLGAVGVDIRSGQFVSFPAKATVLATNTTGFRGHYPIADLVGDGPMMAYAVGADLVNAEFNRVNVGPADFHYAGSSTAAYYGARYVNALGEAFMEKYSPELKDTSDLGVAVVAMAKEIREGRGPIYFDHSRMNKDEFDKFRTAAHQSWEGVHYRRLRQMGKDLVKPEWVPVFFYCCGALKTDFQGQTSLPGLFAAGKARSSGIAGFSGWSFCSVLGTGYQAGESAARFAQTSRLLQFDEMQLEQIKRNLLEPMSRADGIDPERVTVDVQKAIFPLDVMILKNEERLKRALNVVERIRCEDVPRLHAQDLHGLVKLRETRNLVRHAELMLKASLLRTESRIGHYREDYPERDDKNWLKWIVASRTRDGEDAFRLVPLPLERFKHFPPGVARHREISG